MIRLENGTQAGPYRVQRFIKDGLFNGNYVAANAEGKSFFLKVLYIKESGAFSKSLRTYFSAF